MNPRNLLDYFKTPSGRLLVFAAVFGGGLALYGLLRHRTKTVDAGVVPPRTNRAPGAVQVVQRPLARASQFEGDFDFLAKPVS